MIGILLVTIVLALFYYTLIKPIRYWSDRGVVQGYPVPIFGDNWGPLLRQKSFGEMVLDVYNIGGPDVRYSGMYQFLFPTLVLKDLNLIKRITVKDFDHFMNHRNFIPEDVDPMWGKNLFVLTDQKWKDMRSTLSPSFTSSKMKQMFILMNENAEQFAKFFLKQNKDVITVEMKDTFTKFANDVIASNAFGVKVDSLENPKNEFYLMGKDVTDFTSVWRMLKFFGYSICPTLFKFFKVRLFDEHVAKFFQKVIKESIEYRETNSIVRPDIINLLVEARKNGNKYEENPKMIDTGFATVQESELTTNKNQKAELTIDDILAQVLIFFFAGFDAVSSLMSFLSYELAVNPEIQQRLTEEIDGVLEENSGKLTYETLLKMKYLDMVVSESLRKWPNAVAVDRVCTKPYTIQPETPNEQPVHLAKGDILWLPIFGLHRDPKLHPNPEAFDPERFSDENKSNILPYSYVPFGAGPRNCIASRFALLETKALFFHLLANFQIVPVKETRIPLTLSKKSFNLAAEGGCWLGLKRRNN